MKKNDRATIQTLEARRLMAAVPALATSTVAFGAGTMLRITGTTGNDTITLSYDGSAYTLKTAAGFTKVITGTFDAIQIKGGNGNDKITVDASVTVPMYLYGDAGNDTIHGGSGDDFIYGGAGTNWLYGEAGNDTIDTLGNATVDNLIGGDGEDYFWLDNKTTEKIYDADAYETAHSVNRVNAFETARFITGTKTQAIAAAPAGQRYRDPDLTSKTYVYKRFDNHPLFAEDGPSAADIRQGQVGDCYFLSTLASTATVSPDTIRDMITDMGDGTYAVRFKTAAGVTKFYRVDNDLAVFNKTSTAPAYASFGQEGSMWVAIAEKAWAYARRSQGTYASTAAGWMTEATTALGETGAQSQWNTDAASADDYLDWIQTRLDAGDVVTAGVLTGSDALNLVGGHAYTVVRIDTAADGTRSLIVRNPWGIDGYHCTDGTNDGYVSVSAAGVKSSIDAIVAAHAA